MSTDTAPGVGQMRDWSMIRPDDIVRGKDGHAWTVVSREGQRVLIERGDGKTWSGTPKGQVLVLASSAEEMELAVATAQVRLGGVVHAETDEHGRHLCPVTFGHYGALAGHIYIFHGRTVDVPVEQQKITDLIATHDRLHLPENRTATSGYVEHVHEPDFYKRRNRS